MQITDVKARWVLQQDTDDLWRQFDHPRMPIAIEFDDGVLHTTGRELLFSQYYWAFHRRYPDTPLLQTHHLGKERLNKGTSLQLIERCLWASYDAYGRLDLDELQLLAYEVTNTVYNEIVLRTPEYVTSLSALDFIEVLEHPEIAAANENAKPTQSSIDRTYAKIREVLLREGELPNNRIANASKSNLVSMGQTQQVIGPRGYVTDIDSNLFRDPIMTGYATGIKTIYGSAVESRSASKALFFAKDPLADVEYLNRQLQLLGESLRYVYEGDCGSEHLLPLTVHSSADLKTFEGKYYYDTEGHMHVIRRNDQHLVGKQVFVRSPLGCHCLPKQGICEICIGEISLQVQKGGNIGHLSTIELCSGVSQSVLSTKHLDGSSHVDGFVIPDGDKPYLSHGGRENTIAFNRNLSNRRVKLVVSQDAAFNITELNHLNDLTDVPITRISEIDWVCLQIEDPKAQAIDSIDILVSIGSRRSSFTVEFLAYLKRTGWEVNEAKGYEIDLSNWDYTKPVFELPLKHVNMMEFMSGVADIIKFKRLRKKRSKRAKELANNMDAAAGVVMELHDLVNERFSFNVAHCEVILAGCLVNSASKGDYLFPSPNDEREFAPFKELMAHRSMSVVYAFEQHGTRMVDLESFLIQKRPSHPMDKIFVPED